MILVPEEHDSTPVSKIAIDSRVLTPGEEVQEPPPSYYPPSAEPETTVSAGGNTPQPPPAPKAKPTNFLTLRSEHSSVKGHYTIDPCMVIPPQFLPPLAPDETEGDRKNLSLHSSHGSVHADIWLLASQDKGPNTPEVTKKRTTLHLSSGHGSVHTAVRTISGAAPFIMNINAPYGTVAVALPRSFHGHLRLVTVHGSVSVSSLLSENSTTLSQVDHARRFFIGNIAAVGESEWSGDELVVESTHGRIKVKYVDEGDTECNKGFFSRLFGF
ncbi:hypothetical protein BV22DRAFT_1038167 [Leucogyrophana mollusca]|uniref:Uncharacterized protein n=1 Tax=Leucogyrophana mollusca TaxID=85980 RepID=A0ACB8BAD9_9AGAM|nr:hypothetical protein BV22DRAFT_1038167 [Leucogyrophana mollusca]